MTSTSGVPSTLRTIVEMSISEPGMGAVEFGRRPAAPRYPVAMMCWPVTLEALLRGNGNSWRASGLLVREAHGRPMARFVRRGSSHRAVIDAARQRRHAAPRSRTGRIQVVDYSYRHTATRQGLPLGPVHSLGDQRRS